MFLSGGLDSAIVAAIAAEHIRRRGGVLPTFAVGTKDSSDVLAARRVAEFIGSDHHDATSPGCALTRPLGCFATP